MAYSFDAHKNFVITAVAVAPDPATPLAGTASQITVAAGTGVLFPATPFNCIVYTAGIFPTSLNTEVIRVTAINDDVITATRGVEASTVQTIVVGNAIALTVTAKSLTDVESALNSNITALESITAYLNVNDDVVLQTSYTRFKVGKGWQLYNEDTGLWHTKMCVGNPPQDGWDEGEGN